MPVPEPFTATALTAGVMTNLATDILKHHAQALDGTLAGRILKLGGLIEPNFEDRLHDTLNKALTFYFETYPQYQVVGVLTFFQDPTIIQQIGNYILNRRPIDPPAVQSALEQHLGKDAFSTLIVRQRGLEPTRIVPDFLSCYRQVLIQQLTVPQMAVLLELIDQTETLVTEIQTSEARLKTFISQLLEQKLSPEARSAVYEAGQHELATDLVETLDAAGLAKPEQARQTLKARLQSRPNLFESGLCRGQILQPTSNQYFVSHGCDPETVADWRHALTEALVYTGGTEQPLRPYFAGDTLLGGYRLCSLCAKMMSSCFSVFLLPPSEDRNVYLELGIAIGLGAPFFLIQYYQADVPPVLAGLSRYTKGGLFRTMRRELAGQMEEYDFGTVRFTMNLPPPGTQSNYLIAAGDTIEDEDFEGSILEVIEAAYPDLTHISLVEQLDRIDQSGWVLERLVETIQTTRFAIYRVNEACSPTTFLALGISIGLNRPFLMTTSSRQNVPQDLQGIRLYQFRNFVTLRQEFISRHQVFFDRYV